jgi:hypothetical protein
MNTVLVVLLNGDALCAYPLGLEDVKQISTIRQKVQDRVRAEVYAPRGEPVKVQCQVVSVDMPACSPDGFIASLVNDILDKVST